jgi:hypothetical protein
MPTNDTPASPLDRMGRDLARTLLHGGRPADTNNVVRPAMVQTGQQIPADLPAGDITFAFALNGTDTPLTVDHATADKTDQFMQDAIAKDDYLSLDVDPGIPIWVFQQRQYSLANPPSKADSIPVGAQTIAKLPSSVIQEVGSATFKGQFADSYASLWSVDPITQKGTRIALANWQPAIFLRFSLGQVTPRPVGIPDGMQVYALGGAPEGDRWFLDQLGLLPGPGAPQPVTITSIAFALETTDAAGAVTQTPVQEWSIVRSNLSQEARPGRQEASADEIENAVPTTFPYVVLSGDPGQDQDALRMLDMASITNSGGYYFGATTVAATAQSLILSVLLAPKQDPDALHLDSGMLPLAANAIAVAGTMPDTVRFNGAEQIQIKPYSPIGTVAFGWTRNVPAAPATDEDKFGYGTLSIVDYIAADGANQPVPCPMPIISPMDALPGDPFAQPGTGTTAAMRLTSSGAAPLPAAADTEVHYYRGSVACYDKSGGQSPWFRLKDANQRQITLTPGFRDIFGNHFDAKHGPSVTRRMFYTDAIVSPADWPGLRFAVYPDLNGGQAVLKAELIFSTGLTDDRKRRLAEIATQLRGVDGDVSVLLLADPLVTGNNDLKASVISAQIDRWAAGDTTSLVLGLGSFPCNGAITDLTLFNPRVQISRTKSDYLPADSDLPQTDWLSALIKGQIASATLPVAIQTGAAPPLQSASGKDERHDEFGAVAQQLQTIVATGRDFLIGFLRDHLNQHEIWLIPKNLFPVTPNGDASSAWTFATPCPLRNQSGNESYQVDPRNIATGVPDFTKTSTGAPQWAKYGLPLINQAAVDLDFDDLGRTVFKAIEDDTADLSQLMPRANAAAMRSLLGTREGIARQLGAFNTSKSGTAAGFVAPVFAAATAADFDPIAVNRIAVDAILGDLTSFYAVSTVCQMPLAPPGSKKIQTFQGTIDTRLDPTQPPDPTEGSFSDVLFSGGDTKVTFLYDLAPGMSTAPALPAMKVNISHIQLPLPGAAPGASPFNQGPWLELAVPYPLSWMPPRDRIPVAIRYLPSKPVLKSAIAALPDMGAANSEGNIKVDATTAGLLSQWGWSFSFSLVNSVPQDSVHVTVRYPLPKQRVAVAELEDVPQDWVPTSLLQVLFVLKQLRDNWDSPAIKDHRLDILSDLTQYLLQFLSSGPPHNPPIPDPAATSGDPLDTFVIDADPSNPGHRADLLTVMKDIVVKWAPASTAATRIDTATVTAAGESANNGACLTSVRPLRSYQLSLVLTRNETLLGQSANDLLIYQCPPVEWPGGCGAQNLWGPLVFDLKGQKLLDAFQAFFDGLFHGADLTHLNLEAGASLFWTKGVMTAATPFALLPVDLKPVDETNAQTAKGVATFLYNQCVALLGTNTPAPAETDSSGIRLRVKITAHDSDAPQGAAVVLEIPAIDFALIG